MAFGKGPGNPQAVTVVCWGIPKSSCSGVSEGDAGILAKLLWDRNSCETHHPNTLLASLRCTLPGAQLELCPVHRFSCLHMKWEEEKGERQEKSLSLCHAKGEVPSGPCRVTGRAGIKLWSRNCGLCSLLE